MNCSYILFSVVLLVSSSAESTENKREWYPNVNKEINSENNKGHSNAYLPLVEQHTSSPVNNIYPAYPSYNIPPVANAPRPQYYYPVNTYTQQPNFAVPAPVPAPHYLPIEPQYSHYTQPYHPQIQVVQKPATMLSIPYDIAMTEYMSKVLNNVHQGIDSFSGYLQPPPVGNEFVSGYDAQKSVPLGYGYGNRNWEVEYNTPAYSQGVYNGYDSNLGKNYDGLYHGKGSIYGYNNLNGNGYSAWNAPNNADHGNYYYVH